MSNLKTKKNKKHFIIFSTIIVSLILLWLLRGVLAVGLLFIDCLTAQVSVDADFSNYQMYIGKDATEKYRDKWGMDETIFPQQITDSMKVKDYKMVYYDPWDAQYLSYLVVQYDAENYTKEMERLKAYSSNGYIGYYGAEGFGEQYELLAMNADAYQGFVYALSDKKDTIIYVEIIFCNYFMNLDYKKYINEEFLPKAFDATIDNPYKKKLTNKLE